ncbi:MAG: MBOAT family protein [Akkermansiaceae bacterium]
MIWIPGLVVLGLLAGKMNLPRWAGWLFVMVLLGAAHCLTIDHDPIVRMVSICVVLLAGMKGLVYTVWGGHLPWGRYFIFGLGWFGMDPGSFVSRREDLSWKDDVLRGVLFMVIGALSAWMVWKSGNRQILLMFLPMSLGFHFGALRVLKGGMRKVGFPVRTLFPNLIQTKGIGDFWSRRWNIGYSQMMQRLVGRPFEKSMGKGAGLMAVFVVSGLLHEVAITLPVGAGYGLPTLYFVVHGGLVVFERRFGRAVGKLPALLLVAAPLGVLFPEEFQTEVIARCLNIFELI